VFLVFLVTCVAYVSLVNHVNGREVEKMKLRSFLPFVYEMTSDIALCKFWAVFV